MFQHAWNGYMEHGFPYDEVRPITCEPYGPDYDDKEDIIRNDAMGNVASTVLDNLDTLIMMEEWDGFEKSLQYLHDNRHSFFEQDTIVQVFETTIRALGGLLSAHLLLTDVVKDFNVNEKYARFLEICRNYDGFLLEMAYDLGTRLLPAFKTATKVPIPRINLKKGARAVPFKLQLETCTSGATSPVLEFTLLSRLTGDAQFEHYSHQTFWKLWSSRSDLDLLPMTISPIESKWLDTITGIGASVDSFYEYAVKYSIIFNDNDMWEVFKKSYRALMIHAVKGTNNPEDPLIFSNVDTNEGVDRTIWVDALGAFWSGVQVLAGQVNDAIRTHVVYLKLWDYYDAIPERWNFLVSNDYEAGKLPVDYEIGLEWYPLRPEFIESTYYLYRATKDPMYLQIGERILNLFEARFIAECGFHGIQDIRTGEPQNRMETFVMSESLKYLYLLFDVDNELFIHNGMMDSKSWVFSTEAHPLWFQKNLTPTKNKATKIEEVVFKDAILDSLARRIRNSWADPNTKLTETITRNISRPSEPAVPLPGSKIVDYFDHKLDQCEVRALANSDNFMSSGYYSMRSLFETDNVYAGHLNRPEHLAGDTENVIELTSGFYDKFSLACSDLQCRLGTSTDRFELFVGNRGDITLAQLDRIVSSDDYWLPSLNNVRITLEFLLKDKVDTFGTRITKEYITEQNRAIMGNKKLIVSDAVIRIVRVNGAFVRPGETIYSQHFKARDEDITSGMYVVNGRLTLRGILVENVRLVE